ncbi:MAG TPA: PEP/pyruvate-binding domain-containing protein [Burkholderiales bacterium]|nr:PEP/pyruvate-binding domain-containing protein [Burkholderiales bacterium]
MEPLVIPLTAPEAADSARVGPKAANLSALNRAGLPTPAGYCVAAEAYRVQLAALGLEATARAVFTSDDPVARRSALQLRMRLMEHPVAPEIQPLLLDAWRAVTQNGEVPGVVRSSALVEDRFGSSFAGQFESFLGLDNETDFLTAVRACWTALWAPRALRYMATHGVDPADTAMALLIQPLVAARAAGGGLSQTAEGGMLINATRGLGSAIAQGEVAPDRYELGRDGKLRGSRTGVQYHQASCVHGPRLSRPPARQAPCLAPSEIEELGQLLLRAETLMGMPVEIEWALDGNGVKLLQARPLHLDDKAPSRPPDPVWLRQPRLRGQPAGVGWGTGRACVVNCECEISRIAPGDVLVTRSAGPALGRVLSIVAGVVSELGGSTSHLASLARERCVPTVLGVPGATLQIPDGATVAVDGVAGIVRWMRST